MCLSNWKIPLIIDWFLEAKIFIFVLGLVLPPFITEQAPVWFLHCSNITFLSHCTFWGKTEFSFLCYFPLSNAERYHSLKCLWSSCEVSRWVTVACICKVFEGYLCLSPSSTHLIIYLNSSINVFSAFILYLNIA